MSAGPGRFFFDNGPIHPCEGQPLRDGALGVQDGLISYVGPRQEADPALIEGAERIDLDGRALFPGFCDSHVHFLLAAEMLDYVDCRDVSDVRTIQDRVGEKCRKTGEGEWVLGRGWEKRLLFPDGHPSPEMLDEASREHPVLLMSKDAHSVWLNSRALRRALSGGDLPAACVVDERGGKRTGLILEEAEAVKNLLVPRPSDEKKIRLAEGMLKAFYSHGITTVHNIEPPEGFSLWKRYAEEHPGVLRMVWNFVFPSPEALREGRSLFQEGVPGRLATGGAKLFLDGSFGSLSAAVSEPYVGTSERGLLNFEREALMEWLRTLRELGLSGLFHAIGDRATDQILSCLTELDRPAGCRHRLEHVQLLSPDILAKHDFRRLIFSVQPSHMWDDRGILERNMAENFRERYAYVYRTISERGGTLLMGSDAPVEDINPWKGIQAAVTRLGDAETPPWNPAEALTLEEAIACHTRHPSRAVHPGFSAGVLKPGMKADLAVFNNDPYRVAADDPARLWKSLKTEMTFVDGRLVYSSG
ncbi:MAG: amidohydrolase [Elusimicrobiota bacterium]